MLSCGIGQNYKKPLHFVYFLLGDMCTVLCGFTPRIIKSRSVLLHSLLDKLGGSSRNSVAFQIQWKG